MIVTTKAQHYNIIITKLDVPILYNIIMLLLRRRTNQIIFYILIINHRTPSGGLIVFSCHRHVGSYFITSTGGELHPRPNSHCIHSLPTRGLRGPTILSEIMDTKLNMEHHFRHNISRRQYASA